MEEKILYLIDTDDTEAYVRLSETNIKFLNWLSKKGFLSLTVDYNKVDDLPPIAEF